MRTLLVTSALAVAVLSGCQPPVTASRGIDGSETVSVNSPDGSATATTKGNVTTYKDDKGNEMTSVAGADGSSEVKGKSSDGSTYSVKAGQEVDLAPYGIEIYPGLKLDKGGSSLIEAGPVKTATVSGTTSDESAKVAEFYKPKLSKGFRQTTTDNGTMVSGQTATGANVIVVCSSEDGKTRVAISASLEKK